MQPPISLREPAWLREFKAFITRGNVLDLAVGVVIGAAFTTIVGSLVEDIINPVIGLLVGGIDFSNLFIVLRGERAPSLQATRDSGAAVIAIGQFINAVIKFLIVAMAIFWLLKVLARAGLTKAKEEPKGPPEPTLTETLLMEIRDELKGRPPVAAVLPPPGPANPNPIA
ncbi:large conductance mechanosensitive channel protein MscL [Roseomonas sp. OT10]|uniref:large conductance mechanosensitive channel protein MscL n=1 Tax=Roseomonas cutis TaxID=2897332 RepID=UPI001E467BF2|nr:large conductance mechanosensitive channel protein MscL [Roseomonas sp. OT10]UFN49864.1 large conductance mechanosensitive channel protein MscL [Roseomonas sp. OT10]